MLKYSRRKKVVMNDRRSIIYLFLRHLFRTCLTVFFCAFSISEFGEKSRSSLASLSLLDVLVR